MKRSLSLLLILMMLCAFTACGEQGKKYFNLAEVIIDDIPTGSSNGSLVIYDNNKGILNFNGKTTNLEFDSNTSTTKVNDLTAEYDSEDTYFIMNFAEIGLTLKFSQTDEENIQQETAEGNEPKYEGRFYFSNCDGEWAEYDDRSMAVSGTVNNGIICLYNDVYSNTIPMVYIVTENSNCVSGYVMAYKLNEFDAKIENSIQNKDDVNNTKFIKPEEYIWNMYSDYESEDNTKEEKLIEVTTISGTVANADGGYDYKIIITEKAAE